MSVYEIITDDNTSPEAKIRILFSALEQERLRRIRAEEAERELREKGEPKRQHRRKPPQDKRITQLERELKTADALITSLEDQLGDYETRMQEKDKRILDLTERNKELREAVSRQASLI